MSNPYEPPQTECRGPCGDSGCPHKPKKQVIWWQEAVFVFVMFAGLSLLVAVLGIYDEKIRNLFQSMK